MYKPVPQVLPHDDDSENEWDTSLYLDQRFLVNDDAAGSFIDSHSVCELPPEQPEKSLTLLSHARKAALFLAVFNCVGFVLIFLWALPCDCYICQSPAKLSDLQWELQLNGQGIEKIDIPVSKSKIKDVLVTVSKEIHAPLSNSTVLTASASSIIGFNLLNGEKKWEKKLATDVKYLNCHLMDVNNDGISDCLVFSEMQGLLVLDSTSGVILWKCHSHHNPEMSSSPTADVELVELDSVQDLNDDASSDLIVIVRDSTKLVLMALSGRSGELLGQYALNPNCTQLNNRSIVGRALHDPLCFSDPASFNGTLENIQLESSHETNPIFNSMNVGQCPDCLVRLTLLDPVDNTILCNVTVARTIMLSPPNDYVVRGKNHWKIAVKIQHLIDKQNETASRTENHIDVIEIDQPCDETFKILAHVPIGANIDTHYLLHQGFRDSLVVAERNLSAPASILKKIHL